MADRSRLQSRVTWDNYGMIINRDCCSSLERLYALCADMLDIFRVCRRYIAYDISGIL